MARTKRILLAFALVVAIAALSFAQTTEFYIVQDTTTKKCTIGDMKLETTTNNTTTVVGDATYKMRTEAETGMKMVEVCSSN